MRFTKMQGNGNDFIVIEDFMNIYKSNQSSIAQKLCHRHFGIGADGILFVRNSEKADILMEIINSDGSYASMCGNGIRCFAKYVFEKRIINKNPLKIETGDGIKEAFLELDNNNVRNVTINMGNPSWNPKDIPANSIDEIVNKSILINGKEYKINSLLMGVPHTVIINNFNKYQVTEGKQLEKLDIFPEGSNINFCQVVSRNQVKVKTWERGAGVTLACGTGSCASVLACSKLGLVDKKVQVELPGGKLIIEITKDGVLMTGPAEVSFEGEWKSEL
ncbi:MAG: dapF [Clostridiaceae bacterium]|jgi:diaminopimelate epimerase|nr:dapF [Clostridiaceae bacterium]